MATPGSLAAAKAKAPATKSKPGKLKGKAANALANLKRRAGLDKLKARAGVETVMQVGEFSGAAFLSGLAGAYITQEAIQVFGIDARLALGLGLSGYGAYAAFQGSEASPHMTAIGAGIMAAPLVQMGAEVGETMRQSGTGFAGLLGGGKPQPQPQFAGQPQPQPQPQFRPVM